jgi:hypothetical protein
MGAGADRRIELFAHRRAELLGIVETAGDALGIEYDGRGHHRAGQRPAPGFVAARDRPDAALQGGPLAPEGRTDIVLPERETGGAGLAVRFATRGLATFGLTTRSAAHGAMVRTRAG